MIVEVFGLPLSKTPSGRWTSDSDVVGQPWRWREDLGGDAEEPADDLRSGDPVAPQRRVECDEFCRNQRVQVLLEGLPTNTEQICELLATRRALLEPMENL